MDTTNTIAAIATPLGTGGIGVVRISGEDALKVADRIIKSPAHPEISSMKGYTCAFGRAYDMEGAIDEVVVTVFRAPKSYTGEDVVEISCHGGVYILNRILRACCDSGARLAEAGEFTKRAFLQGKLDLTQAEAVIDLICAQGRQAAKAALTAKDGALYRKINRVCELLVEYAGHLAAWIDYPEEDIVEINPRELERQLGKCGDELENLLASYDTGKLIREGIEVAIVGRPNVGKSTLMNLLTGYDRSIVADLAGTTRDVVSDTVSLGDVVLRLSDTAGIRFSNDPVEQAGVNLAMAQIERAQLILALFDGGDPLTKDDWKVIERCRRRQVIAIVNKSDLPQVLDMGEIQRSFEHVITISAKSLDGVQQLKEKIIQLFHLGSFDSSAAMVANERQRLGVTQALDEVRQAQHALAQGISYDAVSVCIENAVDHLLELTGKRATQEVVDQVFSRFCVGK